MLSPSVRYVTGVPVTLSSTICGAKIVVVLLGAQLISLSYQQAILVLCFVLQDDHHADLYTFFVILDFSYLEIL